MSSRAVDSQPVKLDAEMVRNLRAEAAQPPDPVATGEVSRETQVIAIYGKGGIGKSFTLANLSYMMAQQGKKVLLIGCDPKSDTTSLLFGGRACPTIIETSSKKRDAGEQVEIGDVCFKRDGVFAMELGGPEVGRGCGGRGIIHGFELLEKLGFHDWGFDYVLLDFLGDVVCGGFGLPIARGHVPEGDRGRIERPAVPVRGEQRLLGGGVLPPSRRQRRRRRHGGEQGRRHRRGGRLRGGCLHPRARGHSRRRGHSPQERRLSDRRPARRPVGPPVRDPRLGRGRGPAPGSPRRSATRACWRCSRARRWAATWFSSPRPWRTCAAPNASTSRPSRWSMTRSETSSARASRRSGLPAAIPAGLPEEAPRG